MTWSLNFGKRPDYFNDVNEMEWIFGQLKEMKRAKEQRFKAGAWWWVGGEFLIREGRVIWCHRMRNYRDHTNPDVIKKIVGADNLAQ
jgi:hypothetical protein